jgi:ATP-dependent helicase/nuclease subunit A
MSESARRDSRRPASAALDPAAAGAAPATPDRAAERGPSAAPPFTAEQRDAIERPGGLLLTANAGSGKTSVLAERYVRAARAEGGDVGRILAITFTEKAAAELRARVRGRFAALGDEQRARATEGAWISTVHGFCARLLRTHALAAGIDPRFAVLDEHAARRLALAAFERALDDLVAAHGDAALDLIAAYRPYDLREATFAVHEQLRSRGEESPSLPAPRPAPLQPRHAALALARAQAAVELEAARDGVTVERARERVAACAALLDRPPGEPPAPGEVAALKLPGNGAGNGNGALAGPGCAAYREALQDYADACADVRAVPVVALLDALLQAFAQRYAEGKAAASALDFADLELRANRLLREHDGLRARYAERFEHVLVDEFQDTNPLQLELLERIAGERLYAVGDELQSIYGFRHADVRVFRGRRAALAGEGRTATLATNFRSHPALIDALDLAFAPVFDASFTPLVAGRGDDAERSPAEAGSADAAGPEAPAGDGSTAPDEAAPAAGPRVELLVTDAAADWSEAGLLAPGAVAPAPLWRIAEARLLAARVHALLDGGRAAGDIVLLLRATGDLAVYERALVERGVPTYVIGGRGYWSQQQVRDLVAYLGVLANPRDGLALTTLLASPLVGLSSDALVQLAAAARESGRDAWWTLMGPAAPRDPASDGPASTAASAGAAGTAAPAGAAGTAAPADAAGTAAPAGAASTAAAAASAERLLDRLAPDDRARVLALRAWLPAERRAAPRHGIEALIDRVLARTGYDLTLLQMDGGARRMANVRKLMRLAREHEADHGPDLRGFLDLVTGLGRGAADPRAAEDRESEAPVEGEALDAVRLMTIHRAKGLEFPVVCVADLGRAAPPSGREVVRVGEGGRVGIRLKALDGGSGRPALAYRALGEERARGEAEEERRLLYVAATRAREQLVLSGAVACEDGSWPDARPGAPPLAWIGPAFVPDVARRATAGAPAHGVAEHDGVAVACTVARPATFAEALTAQGGEPAAEPAAPPPEPAAAAPSPEPESAAPPPAPAAPASATPRAEPVSAASAPPAVARPAPPPFAPATPRAEPESAAPPPAPAQAAPPPVAALSYTSLQEHARCGYRFYLERVLGLPPVRERHVPAAGAAVHALDPLVRGRVVHALLEALDLRRPQPPGAAAVRRAVAHAGAEATEPEVREIAALVAGFAASELRERLAGAVDVRREQPFALAVAPTPAPAAPPDGAPAGAADPLPLVGVFDVVAREGERTLIVDYKSDRLDGADPAALADDVYALQRAAYALAALRAGAAEVEVVHCFLERPDAPVAATFRPQDAEALTQELAARAAAVMQREFPVAPDPGPRLCDGCPGRGTLCSWPLERTRAPEGRLV